MNNVFKTVQFISVRVFWTDVEEMHLLSPDISEVILVKPIYIH